MSSQKFTRWLQNFSSVTFSFFEEWFAQELASSRDLGGGKIPPSFYNQLTASLEKALEKIKPHLCGVCLVVAFMGLFTLFSVWNPEEDENENATKKRSFANTKKEAPITISLSSSETSTGGNKMTEDDDESEMKDVSLTKLSKFQISATDGKIEMTRCNSLLTKKQPTPLGLKEFCLDFCCNQLYIMSHRKCPLRERRTDMLLAIESFSTLYVLTRSELEATKRRLQESEQERDDLQAHIELLSNLLIDSEKRREYETNLRLLAEENAEILKKEHQRLKNLICELQNERDTLQNQLQRLQQEVTSLRMIICNNTNTSENSNLKNDGENETEMEKMSSTEISLQKQLQNMLQEIERLHQENAVLRQQQQQSQSPSQYTPRVHSHQISLKDK